MADACASSEDSEPLALLVMPLVLALVLGVGIAIAVEAVRSTAVRSTIAAGGVMLESPKHGCAGVDDSDGVCAADADADEDVSPPLACVLEYGRDADDEKEEAADDGDEAGGRCRLLFSISEMMIEWRGVGDLRPGVRTGVTEAAVDANG